MKTFDIDVIARKTAEKSVLHAQGNMALTLTAPSVVEIHGQAQDVVKYSRQGKDLLIYMKDGSVIRCNGYFVEDAQSHAHSELVFNDNNQLTHISFDDMAQGTELSATPLVAHSTPIDSIEPLLAQEGVFSDLPWGWIAGAAVGGGALGALLSSGGGHSKTKVIDNTQPVEKATPTFNVTDNQGDKQGLVATNTTIDDNTPTFSGTGEPGATIQIKDGDGNTIASTMVDSKGSWTVNLPTQTDGAHSWSVTQIDGTNTTSAGSIDVTIATAKAQLVINTIAGDNQLNTDEHQADVTISGLSQQLAEGTQVTVSINGKNYTASVDQSGQWSVVMPGEDAKALADGSWTVTVTATDSTGNHITQTQQITVDTQAPTLTLDTVAGDQVVNATEHQAALILSGASNAASGTSVTVTFGAQTYQATVDDHGKWQVSVPAETVKSLTDGDYSYTASITDQAGNTATASSHFVVDTTAPIITIDAFAGDDVVNSDEQQVAQLLTGKVAGAAAGDIVKVSIGGTDLQGVVAADGTWSVGVPAAIFASLAQGQHSATVSITDAAGNTGSTTHDFTLSGAAPTLSIEAISQDNVINANEALQPLALSGKSNLADGSVVTISLNHLDYQATVTQGVWKITVPATDVMHLDNTLYTVTVTGSDSAGNLGSAQASVLVDTHLPQVSIDAFATDNLVNHDEIAVDQPLSGRVVGAAAGDNITVTLGGKTYTTTVEKDLTWHTTLPAADMAALGDGKIAIDVSVTNTHGNTGDSSLDIDINAQLPGLRIDTVSGDDVINALEQQQDLTVTGNSEHLDAGTIISVTVNQVVYSAVVDDQGHWQIGIPAADMTHWPAGALSITATASDAYGNQAAITHPITVNNDQLALTIDTVSSDDMINAAEQQQALVLSGKTQQVEAGQSVIIKFAGQLFTASVEKDGSWHVTVPASAMSGLTEGRTEISASVADVSGNSTESSRIITVDTQPPSIAIDTVTADNQLNASEAQQPLVISGSSTAEAGQKVTVTLGGKAYSATVDKQGHWQVTVPSDDLAALPQGNNAVTATVSDIAGNASNSSHDFTVDTFVPVVTINTVAGDDVINAAEHQQAQIISGSATGGAAGDTVTITLNGQSYSAVLDAQGQWSTGIPSSAVAALQEGKTQISVTVTDHAGNTGTATHDVTVNTQDPALAFKPIAGDNVLNADEHQATLTLSGQSSDLAEGTSVTVVIAGKSYTATTDSQGNWSVTLSAQDVSALPEGQLSISASATNDVGNSVSSTTTITVDTHLPTISINTTAGDDVINASELASGQTLSGKVSGAAAGDTVTVHLGGNTYTATVAKDLTWSINVSSDDLTAMGNGPLTVEASVTNQHGNTGDAQHAISIDANLPGLRVNTVAGDDVINTIEHDQNLLITGSSQGIAENSTLTVTINGKTYSANVMADGSWSAAVPSSDVSTWTAGSLQIAVSGESSAGNPVNILHPVTVDLADVAISINTVSNDDVLNAAEKGQDLALSGSTHDVAEGSQVTVSVAGHQYTTTVESDGKWAVTVPAADMATLHDGISHVEVSVTTPTGNSAQAGREIQIDTQPPSLTIDNLTQDNVLNAQESSSDQLISGSSTAQTGQEVTVSLNGKNYKTTVDAQGHWQVKIPATDLQALNEGQTSISATVADKAGNSTQAEHSFQVDAQAPVIAIDKVAGDDIINIDEHSQAQIISGSATGGAAGNSVTVTIDGKTYTTVLDAAGKWSVGVPASVISGLQDGNVNIAVTVTDTVGNVGKASHDITVDTGLPSISINSVTSDNVINAAEKGQDLTLSGSTSHIEPGNTVVVAFAGKSYSVVVDAKGNWTLYVPSSALASLKEGSAQVQVSVHNDSGNSAQASHEFMVDSLAPMLQLDPISTNNVVNGQESQQALTLTGSTSAEAGQTVNVTFNNKQYSATVEANGSWSLTVPQEDVAALQDGQYQVSASVEDKAGNSSTSAIDLLVDITAPVTTIATVAGDDVVNVAEHSQALIIQGQARGTEAGDTVAVTLNGKTYNVIVDAQGQWSLGIPATDVSAMSEGDYQVTATVTDKAGNSQSITHDIHVELTAPVLSINTIAGDDIINSTEKGQDLTITGQATGLASGATVTVNLNGQQYTATVDDKGQWSTVVPAADVANLGEANYSVTATAINDAGNSGNTSHTITVGTQTPLVTINTVAGDDVINASELAAGQTLSGKVSGAAAGDTVTVQLGGKTYTATVAKDLTWSVKVPSDDLTAMGNGALTVDASVTNKTGNTGHSEHAISIDANLPGLRVDTVAGDDIVNTIEHNQNLIVSGSSQGIAANSALTVTINGKTYSATVLADGSWSAAVPSSDVSNWAAGTLQIAVSGESSAGNPVAILHPVTVDLAEVAISINTVSGDDVLNAAEKGQDLALSGSTHEVAAGSTVTVTFAGHQYSTTVDSKGNWAVTVPAADMSGLYDGIRNVEVSVTTPTGNSAQAGREILVDTVAPSLTIDNLTQDNVLNAKEAGSDQLISGSSTAQAGQEVTVSLNGKDYKTTVDVQGHWQVKVPAADLQALSDGQTTISASVADKAGNSTHTDHNVQVDLQAPVITVDKVAGDDIININEHAQAQIISGSATGGEAGNSVVVTLAGKTYSTVLDASGNWSVGVPASVIAGLQDGSVSIAVTVTDSAGNVGSTSHDIKVDTGLPTLSINTIAGDDIINSTEKGQDLTITGQATGLASGATVTVNLNGQQYTATVDDKGQWSTVVPAADVANLGEAIYSVSASATNDVGNNISTVHTITVGTQTPLVTINTVAGDDVINASELAAGQTLSGKVSGAAAGDTVTVQLGGKTYTATVAKDLTWSVKVPSDDLTAMGNGALTVDASVTNKTGNTGHSEHAISIDANLPGLRVDTVAGDDIVNTIEHNQNLIVSGSSQGIAANSALTVTINGKTYSATVLADGSWSAAVPSSDVSNWAAGTLQIAVSGESSAGNPVAILHPVTVDLAEVAISINTVSGDDVLNAAEKGQDLALSGSTHEVAAGSTVTVTFAGHQYSTTVDSKGNWAVTVPAADMSGLYDGIRNVEVSVTTPTGNSAQAGREILVDTVAPSLTIDNLTQDNVLNAKEAGSDQLISGSSTAQAGQEVTISLNGKDYKTTVDAQGHWQVKVPAADLQALSDGQTTVSASVADKAGNSTDASHTVHVDLQAPVITVDKVAGDDVINVTEHAQAQIISGSATGGEAGNSVVVTLAGKTYSTVLDASGNWSIGVPASVIAGLQDGSVSIAVTVTDNAGNVGSTSHDIKVDTGLPTLSINTIAGDDIINSTEKGQDLTITGQATGLASGATVTVNLNGQQYTATVDDKGQWSTVVPVADVANLGEAIYSVSASATNDVGNSANTTHTITVGGEAPTITINTVAGDDVINANELAAGQTLSGKVSGAAAGDTVTVQLGGKTYTATVAKDLTWSVKVPSDDLTAMGNGALTVDASVTNKTGNTGHSEHAISIDANLPGLRVDTVAGDDIVNTLEHNQNLIVSGSSQGIAANSALTVTINGKTYSATVLADGSWSAAVPSSDVSNWAAGTLQIAVSGESSAGNPVAILHPVTVDLAEVAISINTVSGDDMLNAAEKGQDLALSGSTHEVAAGSTVTVTFAGHQYSTTVDSKGNWAVTVPAADMSGLYDGIRNVEVSVTTPTGNSAQAGREILVDTVAPSLTIDNLTQDNVLNAKEAGSDQLISGSSTAQAGQEVTVSLNGKDYKTTVDAQGHWQVSVPAADLQALSDGQTTISASVADKAGNGIDASHTVQVDLQAPVITVDKVAGDDVINVTEHAQAQIISGSATGGEAGNSVVVTLAGKTYSTVLDASGNWSIGVPASVIAGLQDGSVSIAVTVTDNAGNVGSTSHDIKVDTGLPTLSINTIAGDDIINSTEKGQDLTITGQATGLASGATVTVNLNGQQYTATVDDKGQWSTVVPAADVANLGEAIYSVSASATNDVGNSANTTHTITVGGEAPTITINTVAGDDVINASELAAGQTLSGKVSGAAAGDTVTVQLGGKTYTATVAKDLTWSVKVPSDDLTSMGNGALTVDASVTNKTGNTGHSEHAISIDANLPGLRVDTVAGDDIVNTLEHNQNLIVSGSSQGIAANSALTVTINGKTYSATVLADGSWSAAVPSSDVSNWAAGTLQIAVSGESSAGNPVAILHPVTVDLAEVAISINTVSGDDMLNAAEKGQDLALSGSTHEVAAGSTVTVTFAGHQYTTTVDGDGKWAVTVPAADMSGLYDGIRNVEVSVTTPTGNSAQAGREILVDTVAPSLTIDNLTQDNVLNAKEAGSDQLISGSSTAQAGQEVTVSLNGKDYKTTVDAQGHWQVSVPAADLQALSDGQTTISASVADKAGNGIDASHTVQVDLQAPVITVDKVAGDDVINVTEHAQAQIISGSATGGEAGNSVVVTLAGKTYSTVLDASGNWSVGVPASVIAGLQDGSVSIAVTVTDNAGNVGSTSHDIKVDTGLPTLSINTIAGDDIINSTEKGQDLTITGQATGLASGATVTVNLNGQQYTATVDDKGQWSTVVPVADVANLGEAIYSVSASATNDVGNSANTTHTITVGGEAPTITINTVAGDDVINASELAAGQTLSGKVSGAAAGDTVTVQLGGKTYTATVAKDLTWSVKVPSDDLTSMGNGALTVDASVTNKTGNTGHSEHAISIDANLPGLRVDTVAGDDIVNTLEHNQNLIVSGSSQGIAANSALTVTINGKTYSATVLADGSWSAAVPSSDVSNWAAGTLQIAVSGESSAGNPVAILHPVTVDLAEVAISINTVSGDDMLNAAEKGQDLALSGSTHEVAAGSTVTVTFAGHQYTTTVDGDGKWAVTVPAADMSGLYDGIRNVEVSVTTPTGNSAQAGREILVDTVAPSLTIDNLTQDNVLNAKEAGSDQLISGSSTAQAGQEVTVSLNGKDYKTTVDAQGHWQVSVPAADLQALSDGQTTISASVADKAGNGIDASHTVQVDLQAPVITVDKVAGDDVINVTEHAQAQIISGSATGGEAGNSVVVTLAGKTYSTVLDASGNWSVGVPASVIAGLQDGSVSIAVTVTDNAGNVGSTSHDIKVDTGLPTLSINTIAGDDIINSTEKGQDLTITGQATGLASGATVTVNLNGQQYTATVDDKGQWSTVVPVADVANLGEAIYSVSASATNDVGNSANTTHTITVGGEAPTITINTVAGDDVINASELAAGQTLSGKVSGAAAGDTVTVQLGGKTYTATVAKDLTWSVKVPSDDLTAMGNGALTVDASVTNKTGNTGHSEHAISIDANLPGLRVDTVAGDDIVNTLEHNQNLIVSGSSQGIAANSALTVTINGKTYSATVLADGSWSAAVPSSDVGAWAAGPLQIAVSGESSAGNPVAILHPVTVDLAEVAISINTVSGDDMLNAAEKGQDLALSGSTHEVAAGSTVTVTFAGHQYSTTVDSKGNWAVTVPAADMSGLYDGIRNVEVSVTTPTGNSAQAGREILVDTVAPSLTIDNLTQDNVLNAKEAGSDQLISGSSTAQAGQEVTISLNGKDYKTTVDAQGHWQVKVPAADLQALSDGQTTISASVADKAGNSTDASHTVHVDLQAPVITFDNVAGDNIISFAEHSQAQIISGSATGGEAGNNVVVTIAGKTYTTVLDAAGKWSVGVPASVIAGLQDGTVSITATITDSAGNVGQQSHEVVVNSAEVGLTIDTVAQDDVINATEAGQALTVQGGSTQFATGTTVTVTLNQKQYTATIDAKGHWQLEVPAADVAALKDASNYLVSVAASDSAGNSAQASHSITVDTTAPVISINTVAGDDVLNAAEQQQPLVLSGSTTAQAGQTVTVTLGSHSYTTTVKADGSWQLSVASDDLQGLAQGVNPVSVSVSDVAGNEGHTSHDLTVDTQAPTITIDTVAGDDIINSDEQKAGQTLSGTSTAEAGQSVTVTFNGHSYTTTVDKEGNWSVKVSAQDLVGLRDGDYTVTATVSDKAGNPGQASHTVTLNGDVPTITIDTFAADDVVNAAEHSQPLIVSGTTTAPAGQHVSITLNGKTYTAVVDDKGNWQATISSKDITALADGETYAIQAQVANSIGNSGSVSHSINVDITAPSMGITIDALQDDTGLSATDFITNDAKVVLNGKLSAALADDEHAQISLDGGKNWQNLTVTGNTWTFSDGRTLADGSWDYQVRVIDDAGNVGATAEQKVVIDTTAPDAATITIDAIVQDTGLSDHDFITSDTQLSVTGTLGAELGKYDHAQVSIDGGKTWVDVSVSGKTWTYVDSRTLTDGKYNYQVRVIDDAGNISATASQVVTVDTQVPDSSKTISIDSIDQDTGLHSNDFITSDTSLTVKGSLGASLSANEYAQISLDNGKTWQNVNVIGTQWNYTDSRTLTDGNYTYWVRVVDAAGNVGAFTHQQVTIDTVAPDVAEKVTVDDITVDSGFDAHDYLTNQTSYTLEGSLGKALQANEYVQVSVDGGKTWTDASVDGTSWRYQESRTLTDGVYNYQVRVIDEAGNIGSTTSQKVTVDTTAPDYGITIDGISEDTGQSASDFITMDQTLTLRGTLGSPLASDERVQISLDGGQTWVDTTVTNKQWTYSDSRTLADGDYQYQVRIIDQAGNVGSVAHQTVTVDTTAPASQGSIVSYTDDQGERQGNFGSKVATDDTAPVINGTLSQAVGKGDIVQLFRDGVLVGLVTMTDSTHWTYQDNGLSDGKHSYFVRVMDLAGNSTDSTSFGLKVDTSVPTTVATINAVTTSDTTPIINGTVSATLEHGEYIQVTVGGKTYTSEEGGAVVVDYAHNTWYLQVPDSSALAVNSYDVTAQIKSSAGNGNTTGLAHGTLVVNTESVNTDWATAAGAGNNSSMLIGTNSQGLWTIGANGQIYNGTDVSSYDDNTLTNTRGAALVNMTGADVNRSGVQTLYGTETTYGNSTQISWTFDGSNYNGSQLAMGTTIWYGGVMAYDRTGDGYLDLAYGDAGMDSLTYLNNNKGVLTPDGTGGESSFYGQFDSGREISGVDLNNDGTVDIVQHTNRSGAYALTVITNKGDGTLAVGQDISNVFVGNGANSSNAASMTWADFNGDGYMDLYIGSGSKGNAGQIFYNDGKGKLATTGTAIESTGATQGYLSTAVDWNGDGQMDVVKFSTYGGAQTATLFTNNNHGASFTASNLASKLVNVTGIAAMDYDWNGTQDLLVSQQNGKVVLIQNNNKIADGTAMHLRIVDSEGINVFYGNTVNLYNSAGKLVASQIINAQSGVGVNDTSALVSFYGLNPNDTYSAQLVKITNGKSDNVTWDNLEAGNGKESYALTADAATGGHSGTLTGTGYNDTFVAEEGSYTYNGGGGWTTRSDHDSWSTTGGVDVVDYRNATAGVNVDLSISSAQDTGFNTSRLVNIEGINGSDFNDVITGSKGDNQFEGRGGNDTFNIGNGGHDTMLYKLINSADATGGNGSDVVNGFTVGAWESTADTDRIDLRELLSGSGYKGDGSASYVDGVATIGASAGNITDYLHVVHTGSNTEIQIDRDGTGSQFDATTVVTLNGVQTDLATLLANHQLLVV